MAVLVLGPTGPLALRIVNLVLSNCARECVMTRNRCTVGSTALVRKLSIGTAVSMNVEVRMVLNFLAC
jgi:hypothetical protein